MTKATITYNIGFGKEKLHLNNPSPDGKVASEADFTHLKPDGKWLSLRAKHDGHFLSLFQTTQEKAQLVYTFKEGEDGDFIDIGLNVVHTKEIKGGNV